jgi:hypothetical protein
VSRKPSGVTTTALPPPLRTRPPRTRRETRKFTTDGVSRSATAMMEFEYASSASASSTGSGKALMKVISAIESR